MTRTLRLLVLPAILSSACWLSVAGTASADALSAESVPVTLTGDQDGGVDVFKVQGGEVKCTTIKYTGEIEGGNLKLVPTYSGCTFAGLASTVHPSSCYYRVRFSATVGDTTAKVDIGCETGDEITVTSPTAGTKKCILHIPPTPDHAGATVTNIGTGTTRELTINLNLTGINYSQTAGTAETGNCKTEDAKTDGTYTGKARITAEIAGTHVGIFLK